MLNHLLQNLEQRARAAHSVQGDVPLLRAAGPLGAGEKSVLGRASAGGRVAEVGSAVRQRQELGDGEGQNAEVLSGEEPVQWDAMPSMSLAASSVQDAARR